MRFIDVDGHRYHCFLTDQDGVDIVGLEVCHRLHARVEDRIAEARELGLARLPFQSFSANETWLERIGLAQDPLTWLRIHVLDADSARLAPRACATACCTSPAASPAPHADARCTSPPAGPGPPS